MYSYRSGSLFLNDIDLSQIAKEHGTPTYVYDLKWLKSRYNKLREALLPAVAIHYAVKANPHPEVLKAFAEWEAHVDVVSAGEMKRSLENGFSGSDVIFSGVAKRKQEIEFALENSVHQLNVESFAELKRIAEISQKRGVRAPVALRVNPDVNPQTHPYITTGFRENKFGIETAQLPEIQSYLLAHKDCLEFVGLTMHIGSQLLELESMNEAIEKVLLQVEAFQKAGLPSQRLDLGGGLGIYYDRDDTDAEEKMLLEYAALINGAHERTQLPILIEPGRWLVGHMGVLLTEIQYIKRNEFKNFVIVDTGMHHLMRPALYQAHHEIRSVQQSEEGETKVYDVVGPICESTDVIGRERLFGDLGSGNILAIADVGAYGACLASDYNLHEKAKEIVVTD